MPLAARRRDLATRRKALATLVLLLAALVAVAPWWSTAAAKVSSLATPPGEVAHLRIPGVGVDAKVVEVGLRDRGQGLEWEVADFAVGHHAGSGVPGSGRSIVLAGHNNARGEVFRRLDEVDVGDVVEVRTADGAWHRYTVSRTETVLEDGATERQRRANERLLSDAGEERLVLVTCWPYQPSPPYRLVVVAVPA